MRIQETESKSGKGEIIYEIRMGFNEIQALYDAVLDVNNRTLEAIEIMPFKRRLTNMQKILKKVILERKLQTKTPHL